MGRHSEEVLPAGSFAASWEITKASKALVRGGQADVARGWEGGRVRGWTVIGTKLSVVSAASHPSATSQAKHCLWAPRQDQSTGVEQEEC